MLAGNGLRGEAEGGEEISGDVFAVGGFGGGTGAGAADAQVRVGLADLESGEVLEGGRVGAEEVVGVVGEEGPVVLHGAGGVGVLGVAIGVAAAGGIADAEELTGTLYRQRAEHYLLNEGEDGGGGADAEGESEDDGGREGRRVAEGAE